MIGWIMRLAATPDAAHRRRLRLQLKWLHELGYVRRVWRSDPD